MKNHSQNSRLLFRFITLCVLALSFVAPAFAQFPEILGIGLSGSPTIRDVQITNYDSIFVVVSYTARESYTPVGAATGLADRDLVELYGYIGTAVDSSLVVGGAQILIDTTSFTVVPDSIPSRVTFKLSVAEMTNPFVRSLQLVVGLAFEDELGQILLAEPRSSADTIGITIPAVDSVDFRHARFLRYQDGFTLPPVLSLPEIGDTISRAFRLNFFLPEPASTSRLFINFFNEDINAEDPHTLILSSSIGGERTVNILDAFNMEESPDVAIVTGSDDSLRDNSAYTIVLRYEDLNRNLAAEYEVDSVFTDFATRRGSMTEPRAGSSGPDTSILVIYFLPEAMDSVWMIWTEDTSQSQRDSRSPHLMLLVDSLALPGQHFFALNGHDFGTNGRYIQFNPRGEFDSLVTNSVYDVTLAYGDLVGNETVEITNRGYIYPLDQLTLQPDMEFPLSGTRENESIYIQFNLPEQPFPGTVHLRFQATQEGDPGSPHEVWLRTGNAGRSAFFLNGNNLSFSDVVDSVTGPGFSDDNNRLVNQVRYLLRVSYRDSRGNPEVNSFFRTFVYDTSTDPPGILTPQSGDTIDYEGERIEWSQFERALPGTLKITLRQTGGPEYDAGSPHILYVADFDTSSQKRVRLEPAFIAASEGIDSVQGGEALVQRGIYECRIEYQDELANPLSSSQVGNLYFPSGSTVYVRGQILGDNAVIPGLFDQLKFMLALRTDGGPSALRGLTFVVDGDVAPTDIITGFTRAWASTDSVFTPNIDRQLTNLGLWFGGPMRFDTFALALSGSETFVFITMSYQNGAHSGHEVRLILPAAENVYCGGDPVIADEWPIGTRDVGLAVTFTDFYTEQDTAFGALRVNWKVASETQNQGFNLSRRWEQETEFSPIASYTNEPALVGRETAASAWRYIFTDRGLVPGARYLYRVEAVGLDGSITPYEIEAEGIPQLPPTNFSLRDAYPNPFNGEATFIYIVPYVSEVEIIVYDLLGRPVKKLVNALLSPAQYTGRWDSRDDNGQLVPSGIYFYRMRAGNIFDQARKFVLIR